MTHMVEGINRNCEEEIREKGKQLNDLKYIRRKIFLCEDKICKI